MRKIKEYERKPYFYSSAAIGGYEERRSPLASGFDLFDDTDLFGASSWEGAEGEMARLSLSTALAKARLSHEEIEIVFAGDLENQCVASSGGLYSFGIPYIGLYSACSTCTEALLLLSHLISAGDIKYGAAVTSSHNSAAERQFRTPIEYGGKKAPTSQWTATAAASFILSDNPSTFDKSHSHGVYISHSMPGKAVDGLTCDGTNMGAAMARAAFDSIFTYFEVSGKAPADFNLIVTGDLGFVGSEILRELLSKEVSGAEKIHEDCGTLLYSKEKKNLFAGASGCGCSASVLASHYLPLLRQGSLKNILFLSTGALMNPGSILRGDNILGIAPIINIRSEPLN